MTAPITATDGVEAAPGELNLRPTSLCDADHPAIVQRVNSLRSDGDEGGTARRIFLFVRDEIPWRASEFPVPASTTLARGYGVCVTKTLLMSALMRAAGIPTRYRWSPVARRGFFGFYPRPVVYFTLLKSATVWYHCHCEAFVGGRWVTADGLLDRPLYEGMLAAGHLTRESVPTIDWGLEGDVLHGLVTEDKGIVDDPEPMFRRGGNDLHPLALARHTLLPWINVHQDRIRRLAPSPGSREALA